MEDRLISNHARLEDSALDVSLRPRNFADGWEDQEQVKENLRIAVLAAKQRGESLDHVILYGPPGLGKTTLAHILANEMGANIRITAGPAIERPGDLASILTNLQQGDILFIDEIHRLHRVVEEILYPAMEDFALDIVLGKGPGARSVRLALPRFTLIGATTRYGMISAPLRDRFGHVYRLNFYDETALARIMERNAALLNVPIDEDGRREIAKRSRGTPRIANRLLKRVRDYAQVMADGVITRQVADEALARLQVDSLGLDEVDHKVLRTVVDKFDGGPVGLDTLAAAISEESDTLMDVYEPFLLQIGFIQRTRSGRVATRLAYEHLGVPMKAKTPPPSPQPMLWDDLEEA